MSMTRGLPYIGFHFIPLNVRVLQLAALSLGLAVISAVISQGVMAQRGYAQVPLKPTQQVSNSSDAATVLSSVQAHEAVVEQTTPERLRIETIGWVNALAQQSLQQAIALELGLVPEHVQFAHFAKEQPYPSLIVVGTQSSLVVSYQRPDGKIATKSVDRPNPEDSIQEITWLVGNLVRQPKIPMIARKQASISTARSATAPVQNRNGSNPNAIKPKTGPTPWRWISALQLGATATNTGSGISAGAQFGSRFHNWSLSTGVQISALSLSGTAIIKTEKREPNTKNESINGSLMIFTLPLLLGYHLSLHNFFAQLAVGPTLSWVHARADDWLSTSYLSPNVTGQIRVGTTLTKNLSGFIGLNAELITIRQSLSGYLSQEGTNATETTGSVSLIPTAIIGGFAGIMWETLD